MCSVWGVYNASSGKVIDFIQCVEDKLLFNGPGLPSAALTTKVISLIRGKTEVAAARIALGHNGCQPALFDVLRENRGVEIFAHSQGNLILSNVLQAIQAVDGAAATSGYFVHTFGSPTVHWPANVRKQEHGFTFDPVNWLSLFDASFSISKVGMPRDSWNPFTHGFEEYVKRDAEFVVNRFRIGMLGKTLKLDCNGLAVCLGAMGNNLERVERVFVLLNHSYSQFAGKVAVHYLERVGSSARSLLKGSKLRGLLSVALSTGAGSDQRRALALLTHFRSHLGSG